MNRRTPISPRVRGSPPGARSKKKSSRPELSPDLPETVTGRSYLAPIESVETETQLTLSYTVAREASMNQISDDSPLPSNQHACDERLKRCTACRAVGYNDDIYCPQCGRLFGAICPRCKAPIRHPVAIYCVRCGEKLSADVEPGRRGP